MSVERLRAIVRMVGLLGFEAVVVLAVYVLGRELSVGAGWSDPARWLAVSPIDQVVVSMVWLAAAGMACWMLGSTLLYLVARCWGLRRVLRVVEPLAIPAVRRVVDRALAATLAGTVLLGPTAPALATEPSAFAAMTTASQSEEEARPAESEQPPVSAPGPQRSAPKPIEQRAPDDDDDAEQKPEPSRTNKQAENDGPGVSTRSGKRDTPDDERDDRRERQRGQQPSTSDADASTAGRGEGPEPDNAAPDAPNRATTEAGRASMAPDRGRAPEAPDATPPRDTQDPADEAGDEHDDRSDAAASDAAEDRSDAPRAAGRTPGVPRPGHRYTVRTGDHLWKIAREVVAGDDGTADRAAVASYWADLVREATPDLRSGDPDLIYPGEQITLPELPDRAREAR